MSNTKFVDIYGAIIANTVYADNRLVGRNVETTLPEVTPVTAEIQALGTMSMPIWQLIEDMEFTITKIGIDSGLRDLMKPQTVNLELRFVQNVTDENGLNTQKGCKAFLKGMSTKIPGLSGNVGEGSANEFTFSVMRYQLFVDGQELFLIDRFAGIVRIQGVDYTELMNSLL